MPTLLLPTVRQPQSRPPVQSTHNRTRSKLVRPSVDITTPLPRPWTPTDVAKHWIGLPLHFDIVTDRLELEGFQIYAVQKWIVERDRPVTVLTVYTGDPAHKITVTALSPSATLSPAEATAEWDKALQHLRRDARPRETPHGVVLATSLAHFRSDYTIVNIPSGDFLQARDQLYTNINLLRMGCSGRSALTLEEPSETTKDRFIATYHLPDTIVSGSVPALPLSPASPDSPVSSPKPSPSKHRPRLSISPSKPRGSEDSKPSSPTSSRRHHPAPLHITPPTPNLSLPYNPFSPSPTPTPGGRKPKSRTDRATFSASVLELVRLIQASLAIFGLFPADPRALDGLLCDKTVEGLGTWVSDVAENCVKLEIEATERIADPPVVCALLSLVLATRNKLAAAGLGVLAPRDPFLRPHAFLAALTAYAGAAEQSKMASTPATPIFPFHLHHTHSLPPTPGVSPRPSPAPPPANTAIVVLTPALVETISTAYSDKARAGGKAPQPGCTRAAGAARRRGERRERQGRLWGRRGGGGRGGQILTGIGNLVGLNVGGNGNAGGAAGVLEPSVDLEAFVRVVVGRGKDKGGKPRLKGKGLARGEKDAHAKDGEGGGAAAEGGGNGANGGSLKEREKDAAVVSGVAGCVRGLWSGLVWGVVALRERELEGPKATGSGDAVGTGSGRERTNAKDRWAPVVVSDGDTEETDLRVPRDGNGGGGRSTEEEGPGLSDKWGGRVQKKIESWTRLSRLDRKKGVHVHGHASVMSVDLSSGRDSLEDHGSSVLKKRPPLPPMHDFGMAPMTFSRGDGEHEEELSSGQVSPVDDPRTPKHFGDLGVGGMSSLRPSAASSAANILNLEEYERKLSEFNHKRPWGTRMVQTRISSWSDPVSAREILDGESDDSAGEGEGSGSVASGLGAVVGGGSVLGDEESMVLYEEPMSDAPAGYLSDAPPVPAPRRRPVALGPRRRRSWHQDPKSFKDLKVLSPERMRIDVALCGQVLIMVRREEHLKNVLACVQVLTASMSDVNTRLREDYQKHARALLEVEQQTKVIADIDVEASKAYKISQAQNTLSYETQQFQVRELWHIASPPRHTTFALRDKVFGMGGRRLPSGKHGAHGRFNRLQWTLDGQERLVDHQGRTESEAEEERVGEDIEGFRSPPTEDEEVVKHPAIRPMWLLRFFTSWGARWGASDADATEKSKAGPEPVSNVPPPVESDDAQGKRVPMSRATISSAIY
ncbi:hypothetical protein MSAN_01449900 [Mycena sanguinolenta]|uniref:STB6-like N-terminal domain-containing protein n=1 Tax=Mycena sanguinolenta TaxID=230812 RepID=A0A8H6YAA5_9AGAR|nr:hypothetical protein MSAN_01449900 [Mycena sanguinolenta]